MEAVALYDFQGQNSEEISFRRGERLCVFEPVADNVAEWTQAVKGMDSGLLPANYIQMQPHPWFSCTNTRESAQDLLLQRNSSLKFVHQDGTFLIRKNTRDKSGFSLSVKNDNSVVHYKVMKGEDNQFYIWHYAKFASVNALIQYYYSTNVSDDQSNPIFLKDVQPVYEAVYDFRATCAEEVELRKGDVIRSVRVENADGWAEGEVTGSRGFFPMNYVKQIHHGAWEN